MTLNTTLQGSLEDEFASVTSYKTYLSVNRMESKVIRMVCMHDTCTSFWLQGRTSSTCVRNVIPLQTEDINRIQESFKKSN